MEDAVFALGGSLATYIGLKASTWIERSRAAKDTKRLLEQDAAFRQMLAEKSAQDA